MEQTKDIFGKRLFEIRESRGESQQELADSIGITRQSLSRYELGERTANIDLLKKISEHYKVSSDYLLGITKERTPDPQLRSICDFVGLHEKAVERLWVDAHAPGRYNDYTSVDLSYLGFSDKEIEEFNKRFKVSHPELREVIKSLLIASGDFDRIVFNLTDLLKLSLIYRKVNEVTDKLEENSELDDLDTNGILRLQVNCDVARYQLIKISEELANHFDYRNRKVDNEDPFYQSVEDFTMETLKAVKQMKKITKEMKEIVSKEQRQKILDEILEECAQDLECFIIKEMEE